MGETKKKLGDKDFTPSPTKIYRITNTKTGKVEDRVMNRKQKRAFFAKTQMRITHRGSAKPDASTEQ